MRRFAVRFLSGFLIVVALCAAGASWWAWRSFNAPGPLSEPATVIVPKGVGVRTIAARLADAGVIDNAFLFVLGTRVTDLAHRMHAGEFAFEAHMSMRAVAEHLVGGETVKRRLTIPEGLTSAEIAALIGTADGLSGTLAQPPGEGTLLPETYFFSYDDGRAELVRRMQEAMDQALAEAWAGRRKNIAIDTPEQALILASIIEKETGVSSERARVSAVFHNRLRRGMRLQSDPTVVYAITGGTGPLGRPLTRTDLGVDSPYNTYQSDGLPPGPIANPGRASLAAAVNPADTKELYFVADGNGGHVFARTLREHNRNVARWRRLMRERQDRP